ncbi:MAG: glycosyltransferase family 4 protein [Candidatus Omnitrophota bacterium]
MKKKIKNILLITKFFPPKIGGVPVHFYNLILNAPEFNFCVLTQKESGSRDIDVLLKKKSNKVIRTVFFPQDLGLNFSADWFIKFLAFPFLFIRVLLREKIDLIFVGQATLFLLFPVYIARILFRKKFILFLAGEEIPSRKGKINNVLKFLYQRAQMYLCISRFTLKRLNNFLDREQKDFLLLPPGVEDKFFEEPNPEIMAKIKKQLLMGSKKVLFTSGRLDKRKGHDYVIRALPEIIKKFPEIIYIIGGTGEYLDSLINLVKDLELNDYVKFIGQIDSEQLVEYYAIADIFIMPNRILASGDAEGFGIVFLEANAVGKPVIGGNNAGALDSVVNGETGLHVDAENISDIANSVCKLLESPTLAQELGLKGRKRAWEQFRWQGIGQKFSQILRELR